MSGAKKREADWVFVLRAKEDFPSLMEEFERYALGRSIDEKSYFDIKLCLEEILINILNYGYPRPDSIPHVSVFIDDDRRELRVEIVDNAQHFNILEGGRQPDTSLTLEERPIGGLGIHLVKELSDKLTYEALDGGNRVVFYKKIPTL